mmetsp:Transcript_16628/g.24577  ORF Transcript_16628/g.24577 Transcript_16628/m.24577 type:complete len:880 (+) Transcript_16628:121-2760(+)
MGGSEEPEDEALAEIINEEFEIPFDDQPKDITRGRRLARFLSNFSCYFQKREGGPSLDAAWAYFEHYALPRHFPMKTNTRFSIGGRPNMKKAEGGETKPTVLYSIWSTPEREMGDFGISIGLYFYLVRVLGFIMFIAGLMQIPNILYFASEEYGQDLVDRVDFGNYNKIGSAICTDNAWVACPTCQEDDWKSLSGKLLNFVNTEKGLIFVLRNYCTIRLREGVVAFTTMVFVIIACFLVINRSGKRAITLDENEQTTSDYSVEVFNPPTDAYDVEEWKEFFSKYGKVDCVTVVIDNEKLVKVLVKRRQLIRNIRLMLVKEEVFDHTDLDSMIERCKEKKQNKARKTLEKIRKLEERANKMTEKKLDVSEVFVIFEREEGQRAALKDLSLPYLRRFGCCLSEEKKFRGKTVLTVAEAREPSAIRWNNLDESVFVKTIRLIISYAIVLLLILGAALVVYLVGQKNATYAAFAISGMNSIVPIICKIITQGIESHTSEGSKEASIYIKVTIFKWVNTAIITTIITPFVFSIDQTSDKLIQKVSAIFFAELVTVPIIQLLDIWGTIQRHILGPRAPDQESMDTHFGGALLLISLRYCELTKILFLAFYYSAIFPMGFFWAAASLGINYWVDKFCILRKYGPSPAVGEQVSYLSRFYFFPLILFFYAFTTAYNYSRWPFDNTCDTGEGVPNDYVGDHEFEYDSELVNTTISQNDEAVQFCNQDMAPGQRTLDGGVKGFSHYPPFPKYVAAGLQWMTGEQQDVTILLSWTLWFMTAYAGLVMGWSFLHSTVFKLVVSVNRPDTIESKIGFSELDDKFGYIPLVKVGGFRFPFLACEVDAPEEYLNFQDNNEVHPYHKHNLMYDLHLTEHQKNEHLFSVIKAYGPE